MDKTFKYSFHPLLLATDNYAFMSTPPINNRVAQFLNCVALRNNLICCMICSRDVQVSHTEIFGVEEIPNVAFLRPREARVDHELIKGALLHLPTINQDGNGTFGPICRQCLKSLDSLAVPSMSLAAGQWVGEQVSQLMDLTLAEKLLVARQPGNLYIIHAKSEALDLEYALGLNDDTHRSAPPTVLQTMPMTMQSLATFFKVGSAAVSFSTIPKCLRVNRGKVEDALKWLKQNNPYYDDIIISEHILASLPMSGFPISIVALLKERSNFSNTSCIDKETVFDVTIHKLIDNKENLEDNITRTRTFARMFPWSFPRGANGLNWHDADVAACSRWMLQNNDKRFRSDEVLISKLYELVVDRNIRRIVAQRDDVLTDLIAEYRLGPNREETLAMLVKCTVGVLKRIPGSHIARLSISRSFWSMALMKGPPTFHFAINMADGIPSHPLSSGMAPSSPRDPYPYVRGLNNAVTCVLENLFGVKSTGKLSGVNHEEGVLGKMAAYISSVNQTSSGGLIVHLAIWITNSPTFDCMQSRLWSGRFRREFAAYCTEVFRNLDTEAYAEDVPQFTSEDLNPLTNASRGASRQDSYRWNVSLMNAANVHIEARILLGGADSCNLAKLMGAPIISCPSVSEQGRMSILLAGGKKDIVASELVISTARAFCQDREISHSLLTHYLLGWGDMRTSHQFVEINLDVMKRYLMIAHIDLGSPRHRELVYNEERIEVGSRPQDDFIGDYIARGWTMEEHCLLEFCITSMESHASHLAYRKRWRYMTGSGRDDRSRVSRLIDAIPHFIGNWFPSRTDIYSHDLYCATVMMLLVPWRDSSSLRGERHWEEAFQVFHDSADKKTRGLIENMEFYYESARSADALSASEFS